MYIILIHVTGIALLEILFYFFYIGPIESELLKNSMKHIVINQENKYLNIHYNISFVKSTEFSKKLKDDKDNSEKGRIKQNSKLYHKSINYWSILLGFTVFITAMQFYIRYWQRKHKKILKIDSTNGLELLPIRSRVNSTESDDLNIQINEINIIHADIESLNQEEESNNSITNFDINNNDYIILEKKLTCKRCSKKIVYYVIFISLLLAFEYCFFQYIVLNYEPLSDNELQYIIYTELIKEVSA